jgi:hypothetical protein
MAARSSTRKVSAADSLRPITDKLTREPAEHPDRIPQERVAHPVTARGKAPSPARRTERPC